MGSVNSSSSIGTSVIVPVFVCFAGAMAMQSVDVRTGYSPRPQGTEEVTSAIAEDTFQLFKNGHFDGDMAPVDGVSQSNKSGTPLDLPKDLEDSLTSLRWNLPPGVVAVFYEDEGGKGEQFTVWGKGQTESVAKWDFNDKATQWAWFYIGGATAPASHHRNALSTGPHGTEHASAAVPENSLQLFKDKNFKGTEAMVMNLTNQPSDSLHALPKDLPDSITSLRWNLPPGVLVMFYQDAGGMKQQAAVWGNGQIADFDGWDLNDKISRWAWFYIGSPSSSTDAPASPPLARPAPAVKDN